MWLLCSAVYVDCGPTRASAAVPAAAVRRAALHARVCPDIFAALHVHDGLLEEELALLREEHRFLRETAPHTEGALFCSFLQFCCVCFDY